MAAGQPGRYQAGIIGRTLRLMLALLLGWMSFIVMRFEDAAFNLRILAVCVAITIFYAVLHFIVSSYATELNRWLGAAIAVAPVVLLFTIGGPLGQVGVLTYVGVSLLLQTIRADSSCEVLSIPTALLRRPTHLTGILFAPIDLVEKHLTGPGGLPG